MSEKFPYESMPWRLEHADGPKVGRAKQPTRLCFFHCEDNALKYIERHKLKKKDYTLECANPETGTKRVAKRRTPCNDTKVQAKTKCKSQSKTTSTPSKK